MSNVNQKVFISRQLRNDSPIKALGDKIEIIDESLLTFEPTAIKELPVVDWLFFYSQQGVYHFFLNYRPLNDQCKMAAFGPKTGLALRDHGYTPVFIGDGTADNTAKAFDMLCSGEKVLFIRARNSRKSLQDRLENQCDILDLIVYDNEPRTEIEIPYCDVLIFTSPLNAKSYLTKYPINIDQKIIAIGTTTRETLHELGISEVEIPHEPSEYAIAQLLIKHLGI